MRRTLISIVRRMLLTMRRVSSIGLMLTLAIGSRHHLRVRHVGIDGIDHVGLTSILAICIVGLTILIQSIGITEWHGCPNVLGIILTALLGAVLTTGSSFLRS